MEARRMRRFGRDRPRSQARSFLPLQTTTTSNTANLSHTISCWFCDYKIRALNEPLFRFGRRHARSLRVWFSVGVGFSLAALLAVTIILLWELGKALHLFHQRTELGYISTASLFGFSPFKVSGLRMSLADAAYFFISTLISVSVHELGHALAAAWYKEVKKGTFSMESSEGIHMEYIAIFIAVLFPGALVAFEYELLQALPQFTALRVYCAGIWHNAVCCAGCGLMLFLLPWILSPFYIHSESPMVLDVSSTSPLSKYLSPGDLIMSLDGVHIHNAEEWMEMAALIEEGTHRTTDNAKYVEGFGTVNSRKGYCVPSFMIEDGLTIQSVDNRSACPNDLTAFVNIPCLDTRMLNGGKTMDGHPSGRWSTHCMNDKDIVKLNKCGDGWARIAFGTSCTCSVDEACLSPLQMPGMNWVEITYLGSLSPECMQLGRNAFSATKNSDFLKSKCVGTFVFVGDVISMAHSVCLTAYHARWGFRFGAYLPVVLERLLVCTFGVSLTLALLNTLPVYFLDGESLLEVILCHFTLLSPSRREKVLQLCLLGGTLISILTFVRIFFSLFNV